MIVTGSYEAKTHLSELLNEVLAGNRIRITSRGMVIAELRPRSSRKDRVKKVFGELAELRKGARLGGLSMRELIDEGRS